MKITAEEVRQIAALARLRLGPEESAAMGDELGSILEHMKELGEVETEGVRPMGGVSEHPAPMRSDEVGADPLHLPLEALSAAVVERFFTVPRLAALDADALAASEEEHS